MPCPSLNELLDRVPLGSSAVGELLSETFGSRADADAPTPVAVLLDLAYDLSPGEMEDGDCEELQMWCHRALRIGLRQLFETENVDALAWCGRAVQCAWNLWKRTIESATTHDAAALQRLVGVASDAGWTSSFTLASTTSESAWSMSRAASPSRA